MNHSIKSKLMLLVCLVCAMVATVSITCIGAQVYAAEPCNHSYSTVTVEPTCVNNGYTEYTCLHCGYSYRDTVYSTGHNLVYKPPVSPTCEEPGRTAEIGCERCDYVILAGVVQPALGHSYQSKAVSPTCTEPGYTVYTCTTCKYSYQKEQGSPFGHEFHQTPSPTEPDTVIYSCLMCGYSYSEYVEPEAPHEHSYRTVVVEPTCTQEGYTVHICDECGESYEDERVAAYGHKFSGNTVCVRCGAPFVVTTVAEGYCGGEGSGTNLTWKLMSDGVLTVSGKGAMKNFSSNAPWREYRDKIKSVVINNGVTTVGYDAFDRCTELRSVVIGNTVVTVEDFAFGRCPKLTSVTVGYSVENIGGLAFCYCPSLMEVINYSILYLKAGEAGYGDLCLNAIDVHSAKSKLASKGEFWF